MPQGDVEQIVAQAVDPLERAEEQDQLFDVRPVEFVVEAVERVSDGVRQVLRGEVGLQLVEVIAQPRDVPVLSLGEVPDEEVDLATILGEGGGDFLAQKDAGQAGNF